MTGAAVTVRPARIDDDFAAVQALYLRTWRTAYRDLLPAGFLGQLSVTSWHPQQRWQRTFLAITAGGQIVGVCSYGPGRQPERQGWGEIYSLYVDPDFEGQGIGGQLFTAAIKQLQSDYTKLYLIVLTNNQTARTFDAHHGFHAVGAAEDTDTPFGTIHEITYTKE